MEVDVNGENINSNSIRDLGRVPSSLLEIRGLYGNNDGHRDPEHIEDTEEGKGWIMRGGEKGHDLSCTHTLLWVTSSERR